MIKLFIFLLPWEASAYSWLHMWYNGQNLLLCSVLHLHVIVCVCVCSSSLILSEPSHHRCKTKIPRASSKELRSPFPNFYETELCCTYLIQIWIPYKWERLGLFFNPRRNPDFISLVRKLLISGWPEFHTRF